MVNIEEINKKMIAEKKYKEKDLRTMEKISMLKELNEYDEYLIICTLCNYDIPEKKEMMDLRMKYFLKIGKDDPSKYKHKEEDYIIDREKLSIRCKNTGNINKFGLYEYEINSVSKDLINTLWDYKNKDCLKYVDSKTYSDKIIISIKKDQFDNYIKMLDKLAIGYDLNDLKKGMFYSNKSDNKLIDLSKLTLPFELYPYQIEDANKIITMKRALLGQEMGCVSGNSLVRIKEQGKKINRNVHISNLYKLFKKDTTIKIKCLVNGKFAFLPIKDVLNKGIQKTIKITTNNNTLECTVDHLIYTKNGWKPAINLSIGDEIFTNGKENPCINCGSTTDMITYPYSKYYGYCRKCSYKLRDNKWHSKEKLNRKVDKDGYIRLSGGLAKSMPNYNKMIGQGGIYEHHQVWYEHTGHIVDTTKEVVHHINGIKTDNRFENLQLLSIKEHCKLHSSINTNNLPQNSKDFIIKNGKKIYYVPKLETITNIEQGETQSVFDIVIDSLDIHNFICNGIVVHNCGKTVISILIGESIDTPKLVICPESLRLNWQREILQVNPNADVQILLSSETPHFGKDWTIVGYLTASKFVDNLKEFDCIFVDEVQYCKSVNNWGKPSSKRAASVITLAQNATYCYLLSGTPLPSHNKDLFNILKMLRCPEFDFNNQWAFKNYADKFCDPQQTYFGVDYSGNSNSDQLHNILKPLMIRRLKKDVLPNLKKQRQFIPIAPIFKKDYKAIMARLSHPNESDTYMGLAMTGRQMLSQYKLDATIDLAESMLDAEESIVIVTNFIETADKLKAHFKDKACEIRGGMTDDDKQLSIDDFQSGFKKVCILNMMAGGVGITLTKAHNMIIMDYAWLPSDMIQVEDRICRGGQTECCNIYYIYCDNSLFDTIFINMITDKSANIDLVVDNAENTFDLADTKSRATTYLDILKAEIKKL